jgi:hypothetical protein
MTDLIEQVEGDAARIESLVTRMAPLPDSTTCPECGREFVNKNGLGVHRAAAHGYRTKNSTKKSTPRKREPRMPSLPARVDLDVDDIFGSVVSMLYPRGVIPVKAVLALVRWRADTERMLTEVADVD